MVSGCSMGAVVGGLYAAGVPVEKLKEELKDLKRGRLMDFYPKALRNMGLMSGDKIVRYLKGLCGDVLIEDLKTAVCRHRGGYRHGKNRLHRQRSAS